MIGVDKSKFVVYINSIALKYFEESVNVLILRITVKQLEVFCF